MRHCPGFVPMPVPIVQRKKESWRLPAGVRGEVKRGAPMCGKIALPSKGELKRSDCHIFWNKRTLMHKYAMSSSLISLALFKKKSMINFVAITWRRPGGGRSSSHLLPENMTQNEKRGDRHRAPCTSASRLAHVMLCKQSSPHVRMSPQKGTHPNIKRSS